MIGSLHVHWMLATRGGYYCNHGGRSYCLLRRAGPLLTMAGGSYCYTTVGGANVTTEDGYYDCGGLPDAVRRAEEWRSILVVGVRGGSRGG